jgi:NADPH:quinone reductase-like Zn-dependent oxidoreductase
LTWIARAINKEEEAPVPTPGTGDALVRVHAASFTPTVVVSEER